MMNASRPRIADQSGQRVRPDDGDVRKNAVLQLQHKAEAAAALLKVMSNADRLLVLCQLLGGEHTVGEIGAMTGIEQPTLSQQLGVLRGEGLVATRREGKCIHYRIASPAVGVLLQTLYELYCAGDGPAVKPGH